MTKTQTLTIKNRDYTITRTSANRAEVTNARGQFAGWVQTLSHGQAVLVGAPNVWNPAERRLVIATATA